MMPGTSIRRARKEDLPALVDIFNFYVENGHVSFGTELHTVESRTAWYEGYGVGRYHLLVAEADSRVIGCCYSSRYRPTAAFDSTVETSIYLHPEQRRGGVGTALYTALFKILQQQPIHLAVAGIALPNPGSIALHRKFGFETVGTFKEYACKRGVWISSTWFQRAMNTHA